jgi:arginine N-succinyltransferase
MIVLRLANLQDFEELDRLAKRSRLLNLPVDRSALLARLHSSERVASEAHDDEASSSLVFVAEQIDTGRVIGAASIRMQHGTVAQPCMYYRVDAHALTRVLEVNGPSELGGLIVEPEYRRHPARIGTQLTLVRLAYIRLFPALFHARLISGLLGPVTSDGQSPFWDAIGKPAKLSLREAESLRYLGEGFLIDSLPDRIELAALPQAARAAVGTVDELSQPALSVLQKRGMTRLGLVDPLDGGPYLGGRTVDLCPNGSTLSVAHQTANHHHGASFGQALVLAMDGRRLVATRTGIRISADALELNGEVKDTLKLRNAQEVHAFAM